MASLEKEIQQKQKSIANALERDRKRKIDEEERKRKAEARNFKRTVKFRWSILCNRRKVEFRKNTAIFTVGKNKFAIEDHEWEDHDPDAGWIGGSYFRLVPTWENGYFSDRTDSYRLLEPKYGKDFMTDKNTPKQYHSDLLEGIASLLKGKNVDEEDLD